MMLTIVRVVYVLVDQQRTGQDTHITVDTNITVRKRAFF